MFKKNLLLGFLFLITNLHAQTQLVYQDQAPRQFLYSYTNGTNANPLVNHFIQVLSESSAKGIARTEFIYNFTEYKKLARRGKTIDCTIDFTDMQCRGDVFYKGFSMLQVLTPDYLDFQVNVLDAAGKTVQSKNFNGIAMKGIKIDPVNFSMADSLNVAARFEVLNYLPSYGNSAGNVFDQRVQLINEYYFTDNQISLALQNIQLVNPADLDNLQFQLNNMAAVEGQILSIESKNLVQQLGLNQFDPNQHINKMISLKQQAVAKRAALNMTVGTLHEIYYNKGLELLVNGNKQQAQSQFEKALSVNPNFAPAHYQLAKIAFEAGNFNEAERKARYVVSNLNAEGNTTQLAQNLLSKVYQEYVSQGNAFAEKQQFGNALQLYKDAEDICKSVAGVTCGNELINGITKAKNGYYQSYLVDARNAIKNNDLQKADELIESAKSFQVNNTQYITSAVDAEVAEKEVATKKYANAVAGAKSFFAQKNYSQAFTETEKAVELEKKYQLTPSPELKKIKQETAKPLILSKIEAAKEMIRVNQLGLAKGDLDKVADMQQSYNLGQDKEINTKLNEVRNNLLSQECANAQAKFDEHYARAKQKMLALEYINADNAFVEAEKVLSTSTSCSINYGKCKDEHLEILPGATYQKLIERVLYYQDNNQYQQAIAKYNEAGTYFVQFELSKLKLNHADLTDFVITNGKNGFLLYTGEYLANKGEVDNALKLYNQLIQRNYPVKKLKRQLFTLGEALAIRDKTKQPQGNPKAMVNLYYKNDPNLKLLRKGYLKAWPK